MYIPILFLVAGAFAFFKWILPALDSKRALKNYTDLKFMLIALNDDLENHKETIEWRSSTFEIHPFSYKSEYTHADIEKISGMDIKIKYKSGEVLSISGSNSAYVKRFLGLDTEVQVTTYRIPDEVSLSSMIFKSYRQFTSIKESHYSKPKEIEINRKKAEHIDKCIEEYKRFVPSQEQLVVLNKLVTDLKLIFCSINKISYAGNFQDLFSEVEKVFIGTSFSVNLPKLENEIIHSFENEIYITPKNHDIWRAWLIKDKDLITFKMIGRNEMKGLNIWGIYNAKSVGGAKASIMDGDSSGPLVWLLCQRCLIENLAFLVK